MFLKFRLSGCALFFVLILVACNPTTETDPVLVAQSTFNAIQTQTATAFTVTPSPNPTETIQAEFTALFGGIATQTATQWTPTPSDTPTQTPTITPTSSPTPIPSFLEAMPDTFSADDIAIAAKDYVFQITRAYTPTTIAGSFPPEGKSFLLIEGNFYNYSSSSVSLFNSDFELSTIDYSNFQQASVQNDLLAVAQDINVSINTEILIVPDVNWMGRLKNSENSAYGKIDYPGTNSDRRIVMNIAEHTALPTFLVYEVPAGVDIATIRFGPNGIPRSRLGIWLLLRPDRDYRVVE